MNSSKLDRITTADLASNPRATLDGWIRFQKMVETAISLHPEPFIFQPLGYSLETVISKIRDAIRGKIAFDYPSRYTSQEVQTWWDQVIVRRQQDKVYLGPKQKRSEQIEHTDSKQLYNFASLTDLELRCFAILLNNGRIQGPVLVKQQPQINIFNDLPNVEPIYKDKGLILI